MVKTSKIFFSRTRNPMILKLGMHYRGLKLYKININVDPMFTLAYFTAMSNLLAFAFEWGETLQSHLMGKKTCRTLTQDLFLETKLTSGDCMHLPRVNIHVCVHF